MGKIQSIVRISGEVGGMVFYEQDGKMLVRNTGSVKKDRILNDPNFKRTRENMSEFSGSTAAAKSLRDGMRQVVRTMGDKKSFGRMVAKMRAILQRGGGERGKRDITIFANADLLRGFEFNKFESFNGSFGAPFTLNVNGARNEVTLTVPDFHTGNLLHAPQGATHFRLVNLITVLSDHYFNTVSGKFEPDEPELNSLNALSFSPEIPIGGMVGGDTTLVSTIALPGPMTAYTALLACVGIEFYQQTNAGFYLLAQGNAMKIADVF